MVLLDQVFRAMQMGEFPLAPSFATKSRRQGRGEKAESAGRRERQSSGKKGDGSTKDNRQREHHGGTQKGPSRSLRRAMGIKSNRKH